MQRASLIAEPMAEDLVGFGKYAGLEYQDINLYQPAYREWVLRTAAEETGCDYRLRRLAQWLKTHPVGTTKHSTKIEPKKPKESKQSTAASSSSNPPTMERDMLEVLQNLAGTIQNLQAEVAELKEERPRKKNPAREHPQRALSETTSEGYTKVPPK